MMAKYASMAAVAVGLAIAATEPASAWGYQYNNDPNYGYGYGAFASGYPEVYVMTYPNGYAYVMTYPGGYEASYRPYGYHLPFYGYRPHTFHRNW